VLQTGALPVRFEQVEIRILGNAATVAAQQWARSRKPVLLTFETAMRQYPSFLKAFTNQGNTSAVRQIALRVERQLDQVRRRWQALPASHLTDLDRLDSQVEQAMSLAASAYADYAAGLKTNAASGSPIGKDKGARALLSSGDAKRNRVGTLLQQLARRLSALDRKYGIS
jgi:hypothetical protein